MPVVLSGGRFRPDPARVGRTLPGEGTGYVFGRSCVAWLAGRRAARFEDFQFDGADAQAIAGQQLGVGEDVAVDSCAGRPTPDDRAVWAAEDQTVQRRDASGAEPQGAPGPGTDRTLGRPQTNGLAVARGAADSQDQFSQGVDRFRRRCRGDANHELPITRKDDRPRPGVATGIARRLGLDAKSTSAFSLRGAGRQKSGLPPGRISQGSAKIGCISVPVLSIIGKRPAGGTRAEMAGVSSAADAPKCPFDPRASESRAPRGREISPFAVTFIAAMG